jgi:hypothetical protein
MSEAEVRRLALWFFWWHGKELAPDVPPMPPDDQLPQEFLDWREMARQASSEPSS